MGIDWGQLVSYGPTAVLLALVLIFILRIAPTWKEVRLKEIDLRRDENDIKLKQATVLGGLSESLSSLSTVLHAVTVEQRRVIESLEILQRVNADTADQLQLSVQALARRVEQIEQTCAVLLNKEKADEQLRSLS